MGKQKKTNRYKFATENDLLSPGITDLNLNKKIRGVKKPNVEPVSTPTEIKTYLEHVNITRRIAMSKTAELFDPIGLCEPVKLQLKLALSQLNEFACDDPLPQDKQSEWKERIKTIFRERTPKPKQYY